MNLLRMWGGAPVQKEAFFEMCDEMGLMVWQEFPLACNAYPDDTHYLRVLDSESRAIIQRLRSHPSVVFWCGGNELFNSWSGMTDQALPLRLLNKNCYELDAQRPYLPTSPVMGMGHGHYVFYDTDNDIEAWACFQNAQCTAYTEFGCPGPSPVEVLKTFIPESELFPPRVGTSWESHHAFGVWMENSWLFPEVIERYFGASDSLEAMVAKGELLQCEGYKGLFEEARRQKPRSSMALNWCYNEAWPCAANNSLLCWPATPKPALYAVGAACRPTMASARIPNSSGMRAKRSRPKCGCCTTLISNIRAARCKRFCSLMGAKFRYSRGTFRLSSPTPTRKAPKFSSCCLVAKLTASSCICVWWGKWSGIRATHWPCNRKLPKKSFRATSSTSEFARIIYYDNVLVFPKSKE
jgi:beta-mannosidase